jgi:hypothetical protein
VQIACNVAMPVEQHSVLTSLAFRSLHDLSAHTFVLGRGSRFTLKLKTTEEFCKLGSASQKLCSRFAGPVFLLS